MRKIWMIHWMALLVSGLASSGFAQTEKAGTPVPRVEDSEDLEDQDLPQTLIGETPGWYPLGLGLLPEAQFPFCEDSIYGANLSLFGVDHSEVLGVDLSLLGLGKRDCGFAYNTVYGTQLGVMGCASDSIYGLQFGGLFSGASDVSGVQISGGMAMAANVGFCGQVAAVLTYANELNGLQVAGFNFGSEVRGAQVGLFNGGTVVVDSGERIVVSLEGAQVGVFNTVNDIFGLQAGVVNGGEFVSGCQIGVANGGGSVNGLQLGAINGKMGPGVCVQIGLLNFEHGSIALPLLNVSLD